jgi:hypothetical protein
MTETEAEMVRRHVAEGERHLQNQRELIERLAAQGLGTYQAESLLVSSEGLQAMHLARLASLG